MCEKTNKKSLKKNLKNRDLGNRNLQAWERENWWVTWRTENCKPGGQKTEDEGKRKLKAWGTENWRPVNGTQYEGYT